MVQSQSSPSVDMSPQWQEFLETKVNSFIKWDLVRFFHDNPHIQDTAENIAGFVGRDTKTIIRALDGLVLSRILNTNEHSHVKIYKLTDDAETRSLIHNFVAACFDRNFRVKAIHHVIHGVGHKSD
jgi:hypothetical protein